VPANSRHGIGDVPEARGFRGPHVFICDGLAQLFLLELARSVVTPHTRERVRRGVGYGRDERGVATC
jgi:hypothetical protein